jgi:trigger factor
MQVSVEKIGDLERRLTVQVPGDSIDSKVSGRLGELRRQVRLKGFRPGRVPMNIIRKRYGDQVREEILQEVMQSSLEEAIGEQDMRVAGISSVQPKPTEGEGDFEFTAELEVFPEMPELEVSDIEVEKPDVEVADSDVDDMIETLREQQRTWEPVDRPADEGDRVRIEYVADLDGQRVPETGHQEIAPVIGQMGGFEELEAMLRGARAGEEKSGQLTFPEGYRQSELAGRTANVEIKVAAVEAPELPEVDEAFAESFGVEGGVEQLRADVRRNLEREMRQAVASRLKQNVTDQLAARYGDVKVPESAVSQEIQQMQSQLQQQTGQQPPPAEQFREGAEKRVRLGLLLAEIARQHGVSIDPSRVQAKIEEIAETYDQPEQVIELYRSEQRLMDQVENLVLEEQVVDWVLENADVREKSMSFKELMGQA